MAFDFDSIANWGPRLTSALSGVVSEDLRGEMCRPELASIGDEMDVLLTRADPARLTEATRSWLRTQRVIGYHGSRLSEPEIASIMANGLRPLIPHERQARLQAILSQHPGWPSVESQFDSVIRETASGKFGHREGEAHLTLSRGALLTAFNHYLIEGSEFDHAVAIQLLGRGAEPLLKANRLPILFTVAVPGEHALEVTERRTAPGEMSGLVRRVLEYWAHWLHDPTLEPGAQHLDFGLIFHDIIPADWVVAQTPIDEAKLLPFY